VGAPAPPPRAEKKLGVIYRENASPCRARVNFRTLFALGGDLELQLVVLYRLLNATTKKRSSTFFDENPGYAYTP